MYIDSQLVVGQVNEEYTTKDGRMGAYHPPAQSRMLEFENISLLKIPLKQNAQADKLALAASGWPDSLPVSNIEKISQPSTSRRAQQRTMMQVEAIPNDLRGHIINYLKYEIQPEDPIEATSYRKRGGL